MKGLRSPWVTGALVVIAFVVVFYQVVKPQMGRFNLRRKPTPTQVAATAPAPAPAVTSSRTVSAPTPPPVAPAASGTNILLEEDAFPSAPVDSSVAQARYKRWLEAPERDPFILVQPIETVEQAEVVQGASPIANWRIRGIWRQTGSRIAAINSGVYKEGDMCEGYKVERIETDQVWIVVSNRLERLRMGYLGKGTNAPPQKK